MSDVFTTLGVSTVINAKGPATRIGGGIMPAEVADAMREATQHSVDMAELQGRASEIISRHTGAEAGIVTSGAAAGLLLGTAATVCGLSPSRMNRLPDTRGMPNRVLMTRSQRNFYDHAVRAAGVRIVDIGLPDRYAGAGVRDAEAWEFAEAMDERTACVCYVAQPHARPPLEKLVEAAHAKGVPVLVDAAAQLPPRENLRRFIDAGADLVAFSGGKAIGGPQASGVLCGRRDLIASALLQSLDMDMLEGQWRAPPAIFGAETLPGLPHHGIGRSAKVAKEQIVGLLVALELYAGGDGERREREYATRVERLCASLGGMAGVSARSERAAGGYSRLRVELESAPGSALEVALALHHGTPAVHVDTSCTDQGTLLVDVSCVRPEQLEPLAERLRSALSGGGRAGPRRAG